MRLEAGQVHVWRAELDPVAPEIERRREALSPDERERAARFRVPRVQLRFTAGRVILRDILSRYLDCPPSAISFGYRQHGKPFLLPIPGGERLRFNLSHSHGLALYGVSLDAEIGIDLEQVRRDRDHEKLARRFFAPEETGALLALPPEQRLTAFFECWTRKEAYLKARGEGLAIPLDSFEVSLAPGSAAGLLRVADDPGETRRWSLVALDPGPGFAAALAVESRPADVRLWQWRAANKG
ncbi:MAG TPA: 4'-phosphopantetheinyl transferase superfamily protein [Bryobacteraceae bacterium]|nr:4'-phosphopantetheinyl transferase superfamily protein [Bryobacteraceae bacterium]